MRKIDSFWDSSALVPLCVEQRPSAVARAAIQSRSITIWWSTPVEITSAFARLLRNGEISRSDFEKAVNRLQALEGRWAEVLPTARLRELARTLIQKHPLRAADGLQLAAALVWCRERPAKRPLVCLDGPLAEAARSEGFQVEAL